MKSMKTMSMGIAVYFVVYFLLAFAAVLIYSFLQPVPPEIIPSLVTNYKFNTAFFNFFVIFSGLQIASILVSYSWMFSKGFDGDVKIRHKTKMFAYLRNVLVVVVVCLMLSIVSNELIRPLLLNRQVSIIHASKDFNEFVDKSKEFLESGDLLEAEIYAKQANRIDPTAVNVHKLLSDIEMELSKTEANLDKIISVDDFKGVEFNIPVNELMDRARTAYQQESYFEAHYYGSLAIHAYEELNANDSEARIITADSWNKLQVADSSLGGLSESVYARKKAGYAAILSGNYLKAYYIFKGLLNENGTDPDVKRYLAIAEEKILNQYFFIDETYNLQPFESVRDIYFSIKRDDGGLIVVGIKGMSEIKEGANQIQYLRGVQIATYDSRRTLEENFFVPYAKMVTVNATDVEPQYAKIVEKSNKKLLPCLILNSVDRNSPNYTVKPTYYSSISLQDEAKSAFLLPIPFEDFLQITEAAQGADSMPLDSLAIFCSKAEKYGFKQEFFLQALCERLCQPFLFVIIALACAILAWKFRLNKKQLVHFWWLLLVPLFSVVSYFFLEIANYCMTMLTFALVYLVGYATFPIVIVSCLLIFVLFCFIFVSMKDD